MSPAKQVKNRRPKKWMAKHRKPGTWRPGQSGNPYGRPRSGYSLAEVWRGYLDEPAGLRDQRSRKERLAERLYNLVLRSGSVPAARLLAEHVAGNEVEERISELEERLDQVLKMIRGEGERSV
jgi:hypothetical protein